MTKEELVERVRTEILDDGNTPYVWSDVEMLKWADEACIEACKRAPLLVGTTTIDVEADIAEYTMDSAVRQILEAKLDSQTNPLNHTTTDDLVLGVGLAWQTWTGTPTHYVRRNKTITLYPAPLVNDTLIIKSTLIPSLDFCLETDFDEDNQHGLMFYIAYKAYLKRDADAYAPDRAADMFAKFNAFYGLPKTSKWHLLAQEMPLNATMMGGRMA